MNRSPSLEQMIELRAVGVEGLLDVEQVPEQLLHVGDVLADADAAAELLLEKGGGAQVIRMGVGLEDPVDLEREPAHERDDLVRETGPGPPRRLIEVERGVDDRTASPRGLLDHVCDRVGLLVEERVDIRVHAPTPSARRARLTLSHEMFALTRP